MKYTRPSAWLAMLLLAILALVTPAFASNDKDKGDNGNHYGHYKHVCDNRCNPHVRYLTNVVTVTNVVTIPTPVPVYMTNYVLLPVYETNYVTETVTNIVQASLDDASANYTLTEKHVYRFYVWQEGQWRSWGTIRSSSNEVVRVIVPGYLTRPEPLVWQVVDVTVGFPRVAVPAADPVDAANRSFVAMNRHLLAVKR